MNRIDVNKKYDVIITGGGLAGCAAARAVSMQGYSALLIEQYGFLGGMATAGKVNPWMPFWVNELSDENTINRGFFKLINEKLSLSNDISDGQKLRSFNDEMLKIVLQEIMEESGVGVLYHAFLTGAETNGPGLVKSLQVATKGGLLDLKARCYIDASGDADLLQYANIPFVQGRDEDGLCQPMTLCFRISNVKNEDGTLIDSNDLTTQTALRKKVNDIYMPLYKQGGFLNKREDVLMFGNIQPGVVHFNSTRIIKKQATDPLELNEAEHEAKLQVKELFFWLKNHITEFRDGILTEIAPQIGIRESRRLVGQYELNGDDLEGSRKFVNSIARGNYGVDIHSPTGKGTDLRHMDPSEYYTIPFESCIPKDGGNVAIAGRPVSSTHEAHSAVRVMPITSSIGDGVGICTAVLLDECKVGALNFEVPDMEKVHKIMDEKDMLY